MLIEEIMHTDFVTIDCKKTIYDACQLYKEKKVDFIIVMDKDKPTGIITDRDIIERVILKDKSPRKTKISDVMSFNLKTINASATLEKANQIMIENNIKKLPVLLNNKIIGIVTKTDLFKNIDIYLETFRDLEKYYKESKQNLEKIKNQWQKIIYELK